MRGLVCDNSLVEVDMSTCELEQQWSELELRQLSIKKISSSKSKLDLDEFI